MISLAVKSWVIASDGKCLDHHSAGNWAWVIPRPVNKRSRVGKRNEIFFMVLRVKNDTY